MPLKLNVGVSKKLGLPEYSSVGASCNVEVELDSTMLHDLDGFPCPGARCLCRLPPCRPRGAGAAEVAACDTGRPPRARRPSVTTATHRPRTPLGPETALGREWVVLRREPMARVVAPPGPRPPAR